MNVCTRVEYIIHAAWRFTTGVGGTACSCAHVTNIKRLSVQAFPRHSPSTSPLVVGFPHPLYIYTPTTTMPPSSTRPISSTGLRKLATASKSCASTSLAYGKCIGAQYQDVSKGMCVDEFNAFKACVQVGFWDWTASRL